MRSASRGASLAMTSMTGRVGARDLASRASMRVTSARSLPSAEARLHGPEGGEGDKFEPGVVKVVFRVEEDLVAGDRVVMDVAVVAVHARLEGAEVGVFEVEDIKVLSIT